MNIFQRKKLHMIGERSGALEQARGRVVLLSSAFVFMFLLVVARSVDLMVIQGELQKTNESSLYEVSSFDKDVVHRGDIVDRNGVILARSLKTASLYADPKFILDPKKTAQDLVDIFPDLKFGNLLQKLQSKKRFVWIKRNITPDEQGKILDLGQPALDFKQEYRRIYPQGPLAVHMVGYNGVDGKGLSGVEASFNKFLDSEGGDNLSLTIDVRLQHALRREIKSAIDKFSAKGGAGVIMDVNSGEVLAAVSLPDFDPQNYRYASNDERFNRVSLGVYELGSCFKIFSTAALLETINPSMGQAFDARAPLKRGGFKIRDYHAEKRILSLPEVFMHSSNIGAALMGEEVGTDRLRSFYKDLGLLDKVKFEIGEVGRPIVPNPWREISTLTASYGHGIAVSPLQLTSAVASIVNGGEYVQPTLILNDASHKKSTRKSLNKTSVRIVSPEVSHRMRQLLRLVVTNGTGKNADVKGYYVGGKTGTADKPSAKGYDRKNRIASFVGVFPVQEPQYVVYAMVDEPQGIKETYGYATGGWVAAPIVKNVISSMASILNIPPFEHQKDIEESLLRFVKTKEQIQQENQIAAH